MTPKHGRHLPGRRPAGGRPQPGRGRTDKAVPSAADGFYLAGYVPLAVGLLLLIRARTPGRDRASLIDAAIIATGLDLLSWVFLMKPAATDSSLTVVGRIIAIAYPAADVLLLGQAWGRSGIDAAAIGIGSIVLFLLVVARMAGLIRQVEHQAAQLEQLAERDPLTGAANRRAWGRAPPVEMDRARRAGAPLAVALLDLDYFKRFNDTYGHQA